MSKKAYRPGFSPTPQYPRLVDVSRRSVLDWGLIAVGSLWLGNAGCHRAPLVGAAEAKGADEGAGSPKEMGLRGKLAISRLPDAGVADAQSPQAKKAPASTVRESPLPPPGEPPQPRLEAVPKEPKPAQKPKAAVAPSTKEPTVGRMGLAGRPAHPRLQDVVMPETSDQKAEDQKPDKKANKKKAGKPDK